MKNFKELAKNVIEIEQRAVEELLQYVDDSFEKACQAMFNCQGRVIVIGMGKSGHIGGKIAATLASTGTPSFFVPVMPLRPKLGCFIQECKQGRRDVFCSVKLVRLTFLCVPF